MQGNKIRRNPFLFAFILSFAVLCFVGVVSFLPIGETSYLLSAFLTAVMFGFPIAIFAYVRQGKAFSAWNRRPLRKKEVMLSVAASVVLMFQNTVLRVIFFQESYDYRSYTLYGLDFSNEANSFWASLLLLLALAVIPVCMEEIFFRGVLMHEYRHGGFLFSAILSSLIYAMSSLDFSQFPLFFLNGFLLSVVFFLTGNIVSSIISRFLYVLFSLFAEKYLMFLALESETRVLFFLFCGAFWIIAFILLCHTAEDLLRKRGQNEEEKPHSLSKNKKILALYDVLTAPFFGACLLCFAVFAILKLFL